VREKHAHAWVEAWTGGAFHTVDATPADLNLAEHPTPAASATYDWARTLVVRALREFARSPEKALVAFSALLGLFVGNRALRGWIRARRARMAARPDLRPPTFFLVLDAALAHAKVPRGRAETLEDWADRLEKAGDFGDAVSAIRAYARHRYGRAPEGDLPRACRSVAERLAIVHGRPSLVPR
jgi:transglutaminase-like putative cysteine protease